LKVVAETISFYILFASILVMTLLISIYASNLSYTAVYNTEYQYYRQVFQTIALNIPLIINPYGGGKYSVSFPRLKMGVGWFDYGSIEVYVNGSLTNTFNCKAIYSRLDLPLLTTRRIVYGRDKALVNDTRLVARVVEYYDQGTVLALDTCRVLALVDRTSSQGYSVYYVRLIIVNLNPVFKQGNLSDVQTIKVYLARTPVVIDYDNLQGLMIKIQYINGETRIVDMREIGVSPPIMLTLIIYDLNIEVS